MKLTVFLVLIWPLLPFSPSCYANADSFVGCKYKEDEVAELLTKVAISDMEEFGQMQYSNMVQTDIDTITTSKKTEYTATIEGYILPGKHTLFTIPVINLGFNLNQNDIVYICFHVDRENKDNNHLTLLFLQGKHIRNESLNIFNLPPKVVPSPTTTKLQTIEGIVDTIVDALPTLPILSILLDFFNLFIHEAMDFLHKAIDKIIGLGVTKVVIKPYELNLYYGMKLLNQIIIPGKHHSDQDNPVVSGRIEQQP